MKDRYADLNHRFKLLNRETALATGLIAGGLADLKKVPHGDAYYYEAFYALSLGIERMLKLLLVVEDTQANIRRHGHNLVKLYDAADIHFAEASIEQKLLVFLSAFASGSRYSILDALSNRSYETDNEPIKRFFEDVGRPILDAHGFDPNQYLVNQMVNASLLHIQEDFAVNDDTTHVVLIGKRCEFIAKHAAMYVGRIIQPLLERLSRSEGVDRKNPVFSEYFIYLRGDDKHFRERKTFRQR